MSALPLLLLDIDGVLNAYGFRPGVTCLPDDGYGDLVELDVPSEDEGVFRFWTSPTLIAELIELATSPRIEVAWLTTWQDQANRHAGPVLGLPSFPVAARTAGEDDGGWKVQAAVEALRLGRPVIWVDDVEITPSARAAFASSGVPHLLIAPDPEVGLTRAHVASLRRFADAYAGY